MEEQRSSTKLPWILGLIVLVVIIFIAYQVLRRTPPPPASPTPAGTIGGPNIPPPGSTPPQVGTTTPPAPGGKMTVKTRRGDFLLINDIYKSAVLINENKTAVVTHDEPEYYISFYVPGQSFTISLLTSDVESARVHAEEVFLRHLGITEEQACELRVSLAVATWANEIFAGRNYGLSFCPDGVPFVNP